MNGRCRAKLRSQSGETIAETLIALLISAFALVMLAGSIGTAARIITQSEDKMQEYYQEYNKLASPTSAGAFISFKIDEKTVRLADETESIGVQYYITPAFASTPVVAYAK